MTASTAGSVEARCRKRDAAQQRGTLIVVGVTCEVDRLDENASRV
jgi:hypothetical protein